MNEKQLLDRISDLEDIAEKAVKALQRMESEYGDGTANPVVREYFQYLREYYHPRPAAEKQPDAAR